MSSNSNNNSANPRFPRFPATSRIANRAAAPKEVRERRAVAPIVAAENIDEQHVIHNNNNTSRKSLGTETSNVSAVLPAASPNGFLPAISAANTNGASIAVSATNSHNNSHNGSTLLVQASRPVTNPSGSLSPAAVASLALVPLSCTANLATVAASVLCDVSTRYRGTFTTQDIDVEQQRRTFTRVVEKVASESESCKSAAVFCETLFMHVKQAIDSAIALSRAATAKSISSAGSTSSALLPSQDDFAGLRIAAACWALDVVSRSNTSFSFILQDIKRLLFPAVFVGFNAVEEACTQRAKAQPALSGSAALVASAPYVVCDLFYQRYARDQKQIRQLNESRHTTSLRLQQNKVGASCILRTLNRQLIAQVFRAWRGHVRRQHIERFARNLLRKNGFRESRSTKLDAAFSRWRLMVEQNRNATLTERCHHVSYQLENAKGQFQLQCFRADKYLRVVEELREELRGARDTREELHKENIRLLAQLEAFQVQARERLEAHVSMLCGELHKWKSYVTLQDMEERERIEASLKFCDKAHAALAVRGANGTPASAQLDPSGEVSASGALSQHDGADNSNGNPNNNNNNDDDNESLTSQGRPSKNNTTKVLTALDGGDENNASAAALNFSAIASSPTSAAAKSEAILLQWCTWAVQQCPISTMRAVTNFATDFINGEAIIIAMNVAAPHHVSLGLLQDVHPIRRLERALESGKRAGFTHLPKVSDFAEGTADLIVLAVAEMFHMWCSKSRLIRGDGEAAREDKAGAKSGRKGGRGRKGHGNSSKKPDENNNSNANPLMPLATSAAAVIDVDDDDDASLAGSVTGTSATAALVAAAAAAAESVAPVITSQELPKYLDECSLALQKFRDNHAQSIHSDRLLWRLELGALHRAAYIARERLEGRSVTVLDRKDMIRFTKFQKQRFTNLQNRYRMPPLDYNSPTPWMGFELQLDLLRESLNIFYPDLRRCFTYYCNGGPTMASVGYWSFCNDIRVVEPRVITRTHLERIFVIANLEDISHASVDPLLSFDEDGLLSEAAEEDEDQNSETLLIPSEFVECVIRIADLRVKDKMLHEKFAILMKDFVNVYACKSETDKFRREINSTSVLAVTDRFRKDLNKIFIHFSIRKQGSKQRCMTVTEFVYFAKESFLLNATFDEAAIAQIFNNVASPSDDMSGRELQAHEFLDALVCVSFYKYPSPFVPLEKKIEQTCSSLISLLRSRFLKGLSKESKEQ